MAGNMGKIWSVNDLMKRYNINRASLIEYAKAKENVINASAVNMQKTGKEWQFNSEAVRILDELRGYGVVVENYDSPEKARIAELEAELEEARKFMAAAQAENSRQKDKIIGLLEEKSLLLEESKEAARLLGKAESEHEKQQAEIEAERKARQDAEARTQTVQTESKANLERAMKAENTLQEERAAAKAEAEAIRKELKKANAALAAEKNKTFWQKIFG